MEPNDGDPGGRWVPEASRGKRRGSALEDDRMPKRQMVSRACDSCKRRKAKCSGTQPCTNCTRKGAPCLYETKYARGRPPTPLQTLVPDVATPSVHSAGLDAGPPAAASAEPEPVPSRASPDLGVMEIQGQYVEPTSGLAFLHRSWKRLSRQRPRPVAQENPAGGDRTQPQMCAGDKPFTVDADSSVLPIPDRETSLELVSYYFDVCVATYRFLHQPTVEAWVSRLHQSLDVGLPIHYGLGEMKAAIVLGILAIAIFHRGKSGGARSVEDEGVSMRKSDRLFLSAFNLADAATGHPALVTVQARLIQVLFLLHSSRMNQAWYVFGTAFQTIAALGIHRRSHRPRSLANDYPDDYIEVQCRKRTFWVAYILDVYLGVIFGRPRHYSDASIDQDLPDSINDGDMTAAGPRVALPRQDCPIDSLILHARIGRLVGRISQEVYAVNQAAGSNSMEAVQSFRQDLDDWTASLPAILGSVNPTNLVHPFRRQATALRLARNHAIMHLYRPYLLRHITSPEIGAEAVARAVADCVSAAREVLQTVDEMAQSGTLFHAFWWTHYVTFCALAVVYVFKIQRSVLDWDLSAIAYGQSFEHLSELAERCQLHLAKATASNSPSRRYSIILEELRQEALCKSPRRPDGRRQGGMGHYGHDQAQSVGNHLEPDSLVSQPNGTSSGGFEGQWDGWQTTDWLDFDSLALGPFSGFGGSPGSWISGNLDAYPPF